MKKVISFKRLNKMSENERKKLITDRYHYFQVFHNCLYCYETLMEAKYSGKLYNLDENGVLKVCRNNVVNMQFD